MNGKAGTRVKRYCLDWKKVLKKAIFIQTGDYTAINITPNQKTGLKL